MVHAAMKDPVISAGGVVVIAPEPGERKKDGAQKPLGELHNQPNGTAGYVIQDTQGHDAKGNLQTLKDDRPPPGRKVPRSMARDLSSISTHSWTGRPIISSPVDAAIPETLPTAAAAPAHPGATLAPISNSKKTAPASNASTSTSRTPSPGAAALGIDRRTSRESSANPSPSATPASFAGGASPPGDRVTFGSGIRGGARQTRRRGSSSSAALVNEESLELAAPVLQADEPFHQVVDDPIKATAGPKARRSSRGQIAGVGDRDSQLDGLPQSSTTSLSKILYASQPVPGKSDEGLSAGMNGRPNSMTMSASRSAESSASSNPAASASGSAAAAQEQLTKRRTHSRTHSYEKPSTRSRMSGHLRDTTEHDEPEESADQQRARGTDDADNEGEAGDDEEDEEAAMEKYRKVLPRRNGSEESAPALARLEKIKKQNDAKRILGVKSPFKRETKKLRKEWEKAARDDSDSGPDLIDFGKAYEGVKLKIAALPGANIIGAGVSTTAQGVAGMASTAGKVITKGASVAADLSTLRSPISESQRQDSLASPESRSRAPTRQFTALNVAPSPMQGSSPGGTSPVLEEPAPAGPSDAANVSQSDLRQHASALSRTKPAVITNGNGKVVASPDGVVSRPQSGDSGDKIQGILVGSPKTMANGSPDPLVSRPGSTDPGHGHPSQARKGKAMARAPSAQPESDRMDESDTSGSESDAPAPGWNNIALQGSDESDGEEYDAADYEGGEGAEEGEMSMRLDLQHGKSQNTRKKSRRRKLANLLSDSKKKQRKAIGGHSPPGELAQGGAEVDEQSSADDDDDEQLASQQGHSRSGSVSHHVKSGLAFASASSRNRRAMGKYSPAPSKILNAGAASSSEALGGPVSRMSTRSPAPKDSLRFTQIASPSAVPGSPDSSRTDLDVVSAVLAAQQANANASIPRGYSPSISAAGDDQTLDEEGVRGFDNFLQRWNTNNTMLSQGSVGKSSTLRGIFRGPQRLFTRGKRKESDAISVASVAKQDPEKELDKLIGQALVKEDPNDVAEKYEYDILYENQRGLQVFGVPRFSSRVLFVGDPAPWTSGNTGHNVAYTIANAQLPDPSWEWVHSEWMIDMSGDVDEAGWQYSGDFGQKYYRALRKLPTAVGLGPRGHERAERHLAKQAEKQARREQKRNEKEDDGLEALKRSALARQAKWRGTSDPWTFVRRRRWIRLRRRRALLSKDCRRQQERLHAEGKTDGAQSNNANKADDLQSEESDTESLEGDFEHSSDASSEDDDDLWASANGPPSGFLPPRLPGGLRNHGAPLEHRGKALARERRRAKEFTGTVRELKSLLPAIIDPRKAKLQQQAEPSRPAHEEIDARNPFISWRLVKRRLADADMAWAGASLRDRERRFQKRLTRKAQKAGGATRPNIPSALMDGHIKESTVQTLEEVAEDEEAANQTIITPQTGEEDRLLTRDALIEINYRRAMRVLRACKVDRQKLELWRLWLGVDTVHNVAEEPVLEDLRTLGLAGRNSTIHEKAYIEKRARALRRWRAMQNCPDPVDVWDVLERRLDQIMMAFEFQSARAALIKLLLSQHAISHPGHVIKDRIGSLAIPHELSPMHRHGASGELGEGYHSIEAQPWREAALPRLQFWSDLYGCSPDQIRKEDKNDAPPRPSSTAPRAPFLADVREDQEKQGASIARPFSALK